MPRFYQLSAVLIWGYSTFLNRNSLILSRFPAASMQRHCCLSYGGVAAQMIVRRPKPRATVGAHEATPARCDGRHITRMVCRVPWDDRGTSSQSEDLFCFEDSRFLERGSIPAASTNFPATPISYVRSCVPSKTRNRRSKRQTIRGVALAAIERGTGEGVRLRT